MKKHIILPIVLLFMVVFAALVSAEPQIMYANRDQVKVYKEQNTESKVLRTLKGGEKVLVEQMTEDLKWASVLCAGDDGEGQQLGWFKVEEMAYVMPSQYCNHEWTDWSVLYEATCTQGGMMERSCPICGVGEARETDPLPHTFGDWTVTRQATCTSEGERTHTCSVCGTVETQTVEKLAHTFGDWTVTKQATCTSEGERTRTCSVCKTVEKQAIAKTAHNFEQKILTEATDHSAGVKMNVCKTCGYSEGKVSFDPAGTLRRGDRSEEVRQMQQFLAEQNYLNDDGADGIFGGGTEVALMKFQQAHGLTPDGVAWPQTLKLMQHEFGEWKVSASLTRNTAGERVRVCKDCGFEQHEILELVPMLEYGQRGDDVRTVQQMLTSLGYDPGTCDGIYGQRLDSAFDSFAKANEITFEAGKVLPEQIDALVNAWIASVPEEQWMGQGTPESPVNLALTVAPAQEDADLESEGIITYTWTLTNIGEEDCQFSTLLLNFGEKEEAAAETEEATKTEEAASETSETVAETAEEAENEEAAEKKVPDFRKNNFALVIDGTELKANGANSISGSFKVNKEWGGELTDLFFTALAASESTGANWLSNVQ